MRPTLLNKTEYSAMEWFFYTFAFIMALGITATAVYALYWSSKKGQLRDFDKGAASIFDDAEPIGKPTDSFPTKRKKSSGPSH